MKYIVELNDSDGNNFQVEMHLPWLSSTSVAGNSTWKTLEKGFLKYHSGGCHAEKKIGYEPTNIQLLMDGTTGIQFFEFFDGMGLVNSSGNGTAHQTWVVGFKPGGFGWTLIS